MAVVKQWGEDQGDGSVIIYTEYDDGRVTARQESSDQNQGGGGFSWPDYGQGRMDSEQRRIDAEAGMNAARIAGSMAQTAMQVEESRRQFDISWNTLSLKDKEELAWKREAFYTELAETAYQFDTNLAKDIWNSKEDRSLKASQGDRALYGDLMTTLLGTAAQLKGTPENWLTYANYTGGGGDVMKALYGSQPMAEFGAPSGYSNPTSITDILKALGVRQIPAAYEPTPMPDFKKREPVTVPGQTPGSSTPVTEESQYNTKHGVKSLAQMRAELLQASGGMDTWKNASAALVLSEYAKLAGAPVTPVTAAGTTPGNVAQPMGGVQPATAGAGYSDGRFVPGASAPMQQNEIMNMLTRGTNGVSAGVQTAAAPQYSDGRYTPGQAPPQQNDLMSLLINGPRRTEAAGASTGGTGIYEGFTPPVVRGTSSPRVGANVPYAGDPRDVVGGAGGSGQTPYVGDPRNLTGGAGSGNENPSGIGRGASGVPPAYPLQPLPHQVNPAVWDSYSDFAKGIIRGLVEGGYTPSGVWTWPDYLQKLNAARPKGTNPKSVQYNWGEPMGTY